MTLPRYSSLALALILSSTLLAFSSAAIDDDVKFFSDYKPAGLQSGPDSYGSTFVSSAQYSLLDNSVIFTGTTWGRFFESRQQIADEDYDIYDNPIEHPHIVSGCFLASASLPGASPEQQRFNPRQGNAKEGDAIFWGHKQRVRAPSSNEACNAVQLFSETGSVLVAGHTEETRNTSLAPGVRAEQVFQYGLMLDLDWNLHGDKSFTTVGGQLLQNDTEVYPTAMTSLSDKEEDGLFVVFMEGQLEKHHIDLVEGQQQHDPQEYFNYGLGFGMRVSRFDMLISHPTETMTTKRFNETWSYSYETADESKGQVLVTDIVHTAGNTHFLLVVGSTNGQGEAFGDESVTKSDFDGFVTKVSPHNGGLIIGPGPGPGSGVRSAVRIQSAKSGRHHHNDWITGVCNNRQDSEYIYLVGTTEGQMPGTSHAPQSGTSAFLMKLNVRTLEAVWTQQLDTEAPMLHFNRGARGMGCAVTPDNQFVWFGGVVEDGAVVRGATKSYGGKDVFVAGANAETGEIDVIKQIGTTEDDELALRGGLAADLAGNAVLIGNTYGSFYREREDGETEADVFVLTVSALTGDFVSPLDEKDNSSWGIFLAIAVLVAIVAAAWCYVRRHRGQWKNSSLSGCLRWKGCSSLSAIFDWSRIQDFLRGRNMRKTTTDRAAVTPYLNNFDIEDVELKHSATGGWHCNFVNNLANGKFMEGQASTAKGSSLGRSRALPDTVMRAPLTSRDAGSEVYLYCDAGSDADNMDTSGRSTNSLLGGEPDSAYGDLVETYNGTYGQSTDRSRERSNFDGTPAWGKDII